MYPTDLTTGSGMIVQGFREIIAELVGDSPNPAVAIFFSDDSSQRIAMDDQWTQLLIDGCSNKTR